MGSRGPIPKRSEDRRRRNKATGGVVTAKSGSDGFKPPEAGEHWHPIAVDLWNAALVSGQSVFYEPTDWVMLFSLCEDLSLYKFSSRRSGQMLQSLMSGFSSLLLTEGDRRRLQIELSRAAAESDEVSDGVAEVISWQRMFKQKQGEAM